MAQKRSRAAFEADLQVQQSPYVFFGTPLPPLDPHTRDDGSYVPVWKQEVTDDRGRKRLHGAFTGGFSAGYFNSVGSKEGWTPQTFVSSRSNRAKAVQKAEDFMDEEDLADAEEAKILETKGGFSGFGSTEDEVGGRGSFMDLFKREGESMGVRLLRKMGWSPGQFIGSRKARSQGNTQHDAEGFAGDESQRPLASKMITFSQKTDTKGLELGDKLSSISKVKKVGAPSPASVNPGKLSKTKPKRSGFGVGVLNDTGSDEEDPYDVGPKLRYGRVSVEKKKTQADNAVTASNSNPLLAASPVFVKKTTFKSSFRRCHDGKLPIDGFVLSTKGPVVQEKIYSMLEVPEHWTPKHYSTEELRESTHQSSADIARASTLNPDSRAVLLGESSLPGQSVFDFLSPAARDKLAVASNNPDLPAGKYATPLESLALPSEQFSIPELDPGVAASALQKITDGFAPYSNDIGKLTRYRQYLTSQVDPLSATAVISKCPAGMQYEDFQSELREFSDAAAMFKPISGAMANRFMSSSSGSGVHASSIALESSTEDLQLLSKGGRQLAPEEEAAKLGMYGSLTRVTSAFRPTRLLCKRFGLSAPLHIQPEPDNGSTATSSRFGTRTVPKSDLAVVSSFRNRFTSGGVQSSEDEETNSRRNKLEILGKKDMEEMRRAAGLPALGEVVRRKEKVDPTRNAALEAERPSDDTFRAIFAGDD